MKKALFTLICLLTTIQWASSANVGDWFQYNDISYMITSKNPQTVKVVGKSASYTGNIIIPEKAIDSSDGLEYSVTEISEGAFVYSSSMTTITFPKSLTTIGRDAFIFCSGITEFKVPEENSHFCSIDGVLFDKNKETLILYPAKKEGDFYIVPDGVKIIERAAFRNCEIREVTLSASVEIIETESFSSSSKLTKITLPASLSAIGYRAFDSCRNITDIICNNPVPPSAGSSDYYSAFPSISSSVNLYVPAESVSTYKQALIWKNFNVQPILFPSETGGTFEYNNVKYSIVSTEPRTAKVIVKDTPYTGEVVIPQSVINDNDRLTYSVTAIGENVFSGCASLTKISLPATLSTIENGAFSSCSGLTDITLYNPTPVTINANVFGSLNLGAINLYVLANALTAYQQAPVWENFEVKSVAPAANGSTFEYNGIKYSITSISPRTVQVVANSTLYSGEITIPGNIINGNDGLEYSVTAIGNNAFYNCEYLTKITLPTTLTSIERYAFFNCNRLTEMIIPEGVTKLENYALRACSKLTTLTLANSITSIGSGAFNGCSSLSTLTLPESLISIRRETSAYAFEGCSSLTAFEIPETNNYFRTVNGVLFNKNKENLVAYPANGEKVYTVPEGVKIIEKYAFWGCGVTEVILSSSVTTIGEEAFRSCSELTKITLPAVISKIDPNNFSSCNKLTEIICYNPIPMVGLHSSVFTTNKSNIKLYVPADAVSTYQQTPMWKEFDIQAIPTPPSTIGSTFEYNNIKYSITSTNLQTVKVVAKNTPYTGEIAIPQNVINDNDRLTYSVTGIGEDAFSQCTNLTKITLPVTLVTIEDNAFNSCSGLTDITCYNPTPATISANVFESLSLTTIKLYIPANALTAYQQAPVWNNFNIQILAPGTIGNTFEYNDIKYSITSTNPLTVQVMPKSIPYSGEITIPENVINNNDGLEYSVTAIGDRAFQNCYDLTKITLPTTLTAIEQSAFSSCNKLTEVIIPEGVTILENGAFEYCSKLTTITLANSITTIGSGAFRGCGSISILTLPESLRFIRTELEKFAFMGCGSLTAFEIPESNNYFCTVDGVLFTKSKEKLFAYPASKGNGVYTVPDGVKEVGQYAFINCGLTEIILPSSVITIGNDVFRSCSALTKVTIPAAISKIGAPNFDFCSKLAEIICYNPNPESINIHTLSFGTREDKIKLYVPAESVNAYKQAYIWSRFVDVQAIPQVTWTGAENTNWNNPKNWSPEGVPTASTSIVIPVVANYPVLTGTKADNQAYMVTIETGAEIGRQDLLTHQTAVIKYNITPGRWNMIATPVETTIGDAFYFEGNPRTWVQQFTETENQSAGWEYKTSANFAIGDGILFWLENTHTFEVEGKLADNSVTKLLEFKKDGIGENAVEYAFVGNPFMTTINLETLANSTIGSSYTIWTGEDYTSYDLVEGAQYGITTNSEISKYIAPLQSFIVEKRKDASNDNLTFDTAIQATGANTSELRASKNKGNKLDIIAENETASVLTFIANREDGLDSHKLFSEVSNVPNIYTVKKGAALGANIINTDNILIPIGLSTTYSGNMSLTFNGMNSYDAKITLIDGDREIELTGLSTYKHEFNYTPAMEDGAVVATTDRFFIRFTPANATGLNEVSEAAVTVYRKNKSIYIESADLIEKVIVYNTQGQVIYSNDQVNTLSYTINNNNFGICVVKVITESRVKNVKLINQ